jgi:small-conductance mechanosensitive channel
METTSLDFAGIALRLFLSLLVVVVTLIVYRVFRNTIKRRVEDATRLQSMRVVVRYVLAVTGFVIIALIWLPTGNNLATALGIVGAGLAIASQELIGSLAAGLNIWVGNIYRVGDRIRWGMLLGM